MSTSEYRVAPTRPICPRRFIWRKVFSSRPISRAASRAGTSSVSEKARAISASVAGPR